MVKFIWKISRKGPTHVFGCKSKNVKPEILRNSEFGTHAFYRLPKTQLKLHCVVGGPSDKPLMLFLHGFPEFWYSWRHQLKEFCKDYRTVAVDMRGYGDSDKPHAICEYILDTLVDDIHQLITELGYEKCVLVGHDWGGAVSWSYAAIYPQHVDRLIVLNCPHPVAFKNHATSSLSQIRKSWYMCYFQWPMLPEVDLLSDDAIPSLFRDASPGMLSADDIEAYKFMLASYKDCTGPINYYRAMRYASPKVDAAVQNKITMSTLLIWGCQDAYLEKHTAEMSSQFVEDLTIKFIDSAHHFVQQDEPQQVNLLMRQFLH